MSRPNCSGLFTARRAPGESRGRVAADPCGSKARKGVNEQLFPFLSIWGLKQWPSVQRASA